MVRLDHIKDLADKFVRVRLPRIDRSDLNVFEFDYDLTFMVFFLNADEQIYGRYGGRDAKDSEHRMSLAGLRYAMKAALETHQNKERLKLPVPQKPKEPKYIRDYIGKFSDFKRRKCIHCHQVREILNAHLKKTGKWTRDDFWRYPLPDNLGMKLEVDRGDVVEKVEPGSPAAQAGLRKGDVVQTLNGLLVHSFGDAQYALDRAPKKGAIDIAWKRQGKIQTGKLALFKGWRRTDISWRPSMIHFIPSFYVYGDDLSDKEKEFWGLSRDQKAFRMTKSMHPQAKAAGFKVDDVIIGVDDKKYEFGSNALYFYVRRNYLVGDRVAIHFLRDGKLMKIEKNLTP